MTHLSTGSTDDILFAHGLERIGASETATLTLAEPVTAAAALVGAALVLASLMLLAVRPNGTRGMRARPAEAAA